MLITIKKRYDINVYICSMKLSEKKIPRSHSFTPKCLEELAKEAKLEQRTASWWLDNILKQRYKIK